MDPRTHRNVSNQHRMTIRRSERLPRMESQFGKTRGSHGARGASETPPRSAPRESPGWCLLLLRRASRLRCCRGIKAGDGSRPSLFTAPYPHAYEYDATTAAMAAFTLAAPQLSARAAVTRCVARPAVEGPRTVASCHHCVDIGLFFLSSPHPKRASVERPGSWVLPSSPLGLTGRDPVPCWHRRKFSVKSQTKARAAFTVRAADEVRSADGAPG